MMVHKPPEPYTDALTLHPHLLVGSMQLFLWLFLRPSAWHHYIGRLDLHPDFALIELNRHHWQNPHLRRLLWQVWVIGPGSISVLVGILSWLWQQPGALIWQNGLTAAAIGITSSVMMSVVLSTSSGAVVGVVGGFIGGIYRGLFTQAALWLFPDVDPQFIPGLSRAMALTLSASMTAGVLVTISTLDTRHHSLSRQIGGTMIGFVIGILAMGIAALTGGQPARRMILGEAYGELAGLVAGIAFGVVLGGALGWAVASHTRQRRRSWLMGGAVTLVLILFFTISGYWMPSLIGRVLIGITSGITLSIFFVVPYIWARQIAGLWAGAVAGTLGSGGVYAVVLIAFGEHPAAPILWITVGCTVIGLSIAWWRPILFYPFEAGWNTLLYYLDRQWSHQHLLRWHSAFWHSHQRLPLYGLDTHLLFVWAHHPTQAAAAMAYLEQTPQRWAALAAQVEMEARWLEKCADITAVAQAYDRLAAGTLPGPASLLRRRFHRYSQDVAAALNQEMIYHRRLALRDVEGRLGRFLPELRQSSDVYGARFYPIAAAWHQIVADQVDVLAREAEQSQEIDNPYVFGVPLTEQQAIFVGRTDVSRRIEQLLLDQRRPPLLLYGQRRMGKTSLLHNLGRLLPQAIVPLYVDGQGIAGASDYADFLYNLGRQMQKSAVRYRHLTLPTLDRDMLSGTPFTAFQEWLDEVEKALAQGHQIALLALDEFEALDQVFDKGRFDETDVLNMLRHLIQHRAYFKVLLAGSHTLDEFQRWASYLINVQVIHIDYLQEAEARQLIERPVKDFALRYEPKARERVLFFTRGHPHLIQLLCYEIVALKNEQPPAQRRLAGVADVETAVGQALAHGSFFFADIERNQVDETGLALLRLMAAQGETAVTAPSLLAARLGEGVTAVLTALQHRELIEAVEGGYRFQIELIRRWFAG